MKKNHISAAVVLLAVMLTGCADYMPDLSEHDSKLITEYSANILLSHDKNHDSRLVDLDQYRIEKAEEAARLAEIEAQEAAEKAAKEARKAAKEAEEEAKKKKKSGETEEAVAVPSYSTIQDFYGIDGFTFTYSGYDIKNEYPDATEDTSYFAMTATEGSDLLIAKFVATNVSGEDRTLDMYSYNPSFKVAINGEAFQNALSTMLLDDIKMYSGLVAAGESVTLTCIVEIPQGTSVNSVDITAKGNGGSALISLQ